MIIPAGERATELELSLALVEFLKTQPCNEATYKTIFFYLPNKYIKLSAADREMSRSRPNEQKWHTVIRNIGAHANAEGNFIHDGILGMRTGRGRGYLLSISRLEALRAKT